MTVCILKTFFVLCCCFTCCRFSCAFFLHHYSFVLMYRIFRITYTKRQEVIIWASWVQLLLKRYWALNGNAATSTVVSWYPTTPHSLWRPCDHALLMYSFKYNQQDATLYNILYYCQCSTCFGRFLRPSSGAQELYTQHLVFARLACCYRLAVAASKPGKYQMLCVQFLSSWWWAEKPPETSRALTVILNIV